MKKLTERDYWRTTPSTIEDAIDLSGGRTIALDACVEKPEYSYGLNCITEKQNAFVADWGNKMRLSPMPEQPMIWCNPPYSQKEEFFHLCARQVAILEIPVMMLIPFAPTTAWWDRTVCMYNSEVFIPNGRICFMHPETEVVERSPRIATCLVYLTPEAVADALVGETDNVTYTHYTRRQEWLNS